MLIPQLNNIILDSLFFKLRFIFPDALLDRYAQVIHGLPHPWRTKVQIQFVKLAFVPNFFDVVVVSWLQYLLGRV